MSPRIKLLGIAGVIVIVTAVTWLALFLTQPSIRRGHYEINFAGLNDWRLAAEPIVIHANYGPQGCRVESAGRSVQVGPVVIEHWVY